MKTQWTILLLSAFSERLMTALAVNGDSVITLEEGTCPITPEIIRSNAVDFVVCFGYGRILGRTVLDMVPAINVHGGYLPFNRGPNPNLWSILDGTPRGVSIHYIDFGIDTGDLIAQRELPLFDDSTSTLLSSFNDIVDASVQLFEESWPLIRAGRNERIPQPVGGTAHKLADQAALVELLDGEGVALPLHVFRSRAWHLLGRTQAVSNKRRVGR